MKIKQRQTGASLVISLIMLMVLTLLVIAAIRSGNTNLRISGNMQTQTEAAGVAQQVVEQIIDVGTVAAPNDFTKTPAQTLTVTAGAITYNVAIAAPVCENSIPILSNDPTLSAASDDDRLCFGEGDTGDIIIDASGKPVVKATKCNFQNWQVKATATNPSTNVNVTVHQGVAKRMYSPTPCP